MDIGGVLFTKYSAYRKIWECSGLLGKPTHILLYTLFKSSLD